MTNDNKLNQMSIVREQDPRTTLQLSISTQDE